MMDQHDRPLRILHVLRAPLGGLFRHVLDLTREQVARGHSVGLITDELTGGERAKDALAELAPSLQLGVLRLPMRRAPHLSDIRALAICDAHARKLDADVLHGHGSKGGLYARLPAYWTRGQQPIRCYTPHGGSFNHVAAPLIQSLYMGVERLLAARTDVLLFESVFIGTRFNQGVGETSALSRIVQNGISPAEFVPVETHPDAADFLYIGELRAAKGIDTLLDALALLSRRYNKAFSLVLVGAGPDKTKLVRRAEDLGIIGNVSFPGAKPARKAFEMGRVLIVPSRAESLPYVVLEGAGARIPMIATDVGGIGEVFGPYRDRLIPCDNVPVLAQSMDAMIHADAGDIKRRADDLAAFVATRFSIANMADSVIAGYRDAFAHRHAAHDDPAPSFAIPS